MILISYIEWHYTRALREMVSIWSTLLWFVFNFFSFTILFKTLLSPFKRLDEDKTKKIAPDVLFVNFMMRLVGFLLRMLVIIIGFVFLLVTVIGGLLSFVVWITMPAVLGGLAVLPVLIFS